LEDATDEERAALQDLSAELLVPLPGRNRLLGMMTLGPKRSEEPYSRTDRQLLQSVASQTGLALENAELLQNLTAEITQRERISSEIEIARDVQQRLFPQSYPEIAGLDLAGHCRPAQAVGGDYYDLFATVSSGSNGEESRLGLAIGDISGKGISASLLMASLRAGLRIVARMDTTPAGRDLTQMMRQVNRLVFESSASNRYATFFFGELDPQTRLLTFVNAGHNPPLLLRGSEAIPLPPTGMVIGLLEDAGFGQTTIQLQPGDVLLAYTDGISEAMNAAEEEWGEEAMLQAAKTLVNDPGCAWSAESLVDCLFREADRFTAGAPQHDDMTVVVCVVQ
jgi:sigma-B regulation protein RsbU (phosphoserine phosphatase)